MKRIIEIDGLRGVLEYEWRDKTPGRKNLGRMEFSVCLKYNHGKITEFWVDPVQSHIPVMWHWPHQIEDFCISAYQGLRSEGAWRVSYCEEHKATSLHIYSPENARFLSICSHGFEFWKEDVFDGKYRTEGSL